MNVLFDVLLVALFAFFVIRGYVKGFFKTVLSLGRLALAVVITLMAGPSFAKWLDRALIHPPVYEAVHEKISGLAEAAGGRADAFLEDASRAFGGFVDLSSLQTGDGLDSMAESLSRSIGQAVSAAISTVLGYILLFAIVFALLTVAVFLVGKLVELPVLRGCDKLLGLGLGAVSGLLAVIMLSAVLYAVVYATGDMSALDDSVVFKFVHSINLFALKP